MIYKTLVVHLSQTHRLVDLAIQHSELLEVQPAEIKLATCLQVILNAGWSITKENWEEMLEVSGVADVRAHYWDSYNMRKDDLLTKQVENLENNFLDSHIFSKEEKNEIKEQLNGKDLSSVTIKPAETEEAKK